MELSKDQLVELVLEVRNPEAIQDAQKLVDSFVASHTPSIGRSRSSPPQYRRTWFPRSATPLPLVINVIKGEKKWQIQQPQ